MHPSVALMLRNPRQRQAIERALAARGRGGDTMIAHLNPAEALMLKRLGGSGTINPRTGLPEFTADPRGDIGGGSNHDNQPGNDAGMGGDVGNGVGGNRGGHVGGLDSEHRGQGGIIETNQPRPVIQQPPVLPPPPVVQPPAPIPVATAPMMSSTATTDLTGGRFGKLPGWDLKPYQIGTAPTSYPTPGLTPPPTATKPPPPTGGGGVVPPPPTGGGNGGLGGLGGDPNHPGTTTGTVGHPGMDSTVANFMDVLAQHGIHPPPHDPVALTPPRPTPGGGISRGLAKSPLGQAMIANGAKVRQQPVPQPPPPPGPPPPTAQQCLLMAAGGGRPQPRPQPLSAQGLPGGLGGLGGLQGIVPNHPVTPPAPSKPPTKQGLLASLASAPAKTAPTKTAVATKKTTSKTGGKKDR